MSHTRCAIGLSLFMVTAAVYEAVACGEYVCATGEFASRTFADPATRPSGYVGPLYTFERIRAAAFAGDAVTLWTINEEAVKRYRLMDGAELMCAIEGSKGAVSPDGRWLATNMDGKVILWDAKHPSFPRKTQVSAVPARMMGFSPDGSLLWVASGRYRLQLFQTATGKMVSELTEHRDTINGVAISADNCLVLTGSGRVHDTAPQFTWGRGTLDNSARLWEVASGKMLECREYGERVPVTAVAFDAQGHAFANRMPIFGADKDVRMLDQPDTRVTVSRDGLVALVVGVTGKAVLYALPR